MRRFSCDEARSHLSDALAGVVGRPEANVLEAHLLGCDPCRSLSELFLWQDRVLSELAAQARLDALLSKVRLGLAHLDQIVLPEDSEPRWTWTFSWRWAWAAAAAFLVALLAVVLGRPQPPQEVATRPPVAPLRAEPSVIPTLEPKEAPPEVHEESPLPPPVEVPPTPPPPQSPSPPPDLTASAGSKPDPTIRKESLPPSPRPLETPPVPTARADVVQQAPPAPAKLRTLDASVKGGMAFLRARSAASPKEAKNDELILWTYLQGGILESDPEFQSLLRPMLEGKLERTYNVAFTAMVLEELDRVKYQKRIAQCAQFLLDNQCANGQWTYGAPSIFAEDLNVPLMPLKFKGVRRIAVVRKRDGTAVGDNSNSMYAMLGLRACHDAGIILPRETVMLAAKWWRESQTRTSPVKPPAIAPEGWCYGRHDHKPYGSMTVGGVGSLVICDYILGVDWKRDPQVASGMEWLARNFSVTYNPGPYEHAGMEENSQHQFYYYMYGLERAAILYGTEQIGGHYWFAKGVQVLLDAQRPDGSWKEVPGGNEVNDTCFAVLFMRKATRALLDVATPGGSSPKK